MPSKLFHAVVGVGISLGSAAACGGVADRDGPAELSPDAQAPVPHPQADGGSDAPTAPPTFDAAAPDGATTANSAADTTVALDASIADAALDAPKDAIIDAFCDDPWPITKSGRVVCGPVEDCAGTSTPWCIAVDAQGTCTMMPVVCVDKQWQCLGGATPTPTPGPSWPCQ